MTNGIHSEAALEWRTWGMAVLLVAAGLLTGWNSARVPQPKAAEYPATPLGAPFHGAAPSQSVLPKSLAAKLAPPWAYHEPAGGFPIDPGKDLSARPTPFSYRAMGAHSIAAADTRTD
jgi:hypothetical protein